jgi:hypothetical protein
MPCKLKQSTKPGIDFEGTAGAKAKLSVRSTGDDPAAVELDFVRYNSKTVTTDPAAIEVAGGVKPLIVGLRGTVNGQVGHLVEVCPDGTEQELRRLRFNALVHRANSSL